MSEPPRGYIADTNVLSNRGTVEVDTHLIEWLRRCARRLRVSVVTLAEMRRGLILLDVRVAALTDGKARLREQQRLARKWR